MLDSEISRYEQDIIPTNSGDLKGEREVYYRSIWEQAKDKKFSWDEQHTLLVKILAHLTVERDDPAWLKGLDRMILDVLPHKAFHPYEISRRLDPTTFANCDFESLRRYFSRQLDELGPDLEFYELSNQPNSTDGKTVINVSNSPYCEHLGDLKCRNGFIDPQGNIFEVEGDRHEIWAAQFVADRSKNADRGGEHTLRAEGWKKLRALEWEDSDYTTEQMSTVLLWADYHHSRDSIPASIVRKLQIIKNGVDDQDLKTTTISKQLDIGKKATEQDTRAHDFIYQRLLQYKIPGEKDNTREKELDKSVRAAARDLLVVWKKPVLNTQEGYFPLAKR